MALSERLSDLSTGITNLLGNPTGAVYKSQSLAALDSVISQVSALLPSAPRSPDECACGAGGGDDADRTANGPQRPGQRLLRWPRRDRRHRRPRLHRVDFAQLQHGAPTTPTVFAISLQNTGSMATTYDLAVTNLAANVTAKFATGQATQKVTLQPGQSLAGNNAINLNVQETGGSLFATNFTVTVTPEGAGSWSRGCGLADAAAGVHQRRLGHGHAPFTNPGGKVAVSAGVLAEVNSRSRCTPPSRSRMPPARPCSRPRRCR